MKLFIRRVIVVLLLFNIVVTILYFMQDDKPHLNYWDCTVGVTEVSLITVGAIVLLWGLVTLLMWLWED